MQNRTTSTPRNIESVYSKRVGQSGGIWQTYDTTSGLPGAVRCMRQDLQGYLWLGTGVGLCRYDGVEFLTYTTADGLADNRIGCLTQDRSGRIWFAEGWWLTTPGWGATCFDGKRFTTYTDADGLADNHVRTIIQDREERLWFGTQNGLSCFDGQRFVTYTAEDGLADNRIRAIYEDHLGRLWVSTDSHGLTCFDGERFTTYTTENGLAANGVWSIGEDHQGRLWVSAWGAGVSCFDGETFTTYTTENGLAANRVWCIYSDRQERLWFGTWGGGVSCFDGEQFVTYTAEDGLPGNRINDILQDREGHLWFADHLAGLARFDARTVQWLSEESVTEILIQDRGGRLWFSNDHRLYCLSERGQRCQAFHSRIFSLLEDSRGRFWVGTWEDGLYCYPSADAVWNGTPEHFTKTDGLNSNCALSLLEARDGTIWVGTGNPGCLCCWRGQAFEAIPTPHPIIARLYEDSQGGIWMGGWEDGRISRYHEGHLATDMAMEEFSDSGVRAIVEDDAGRLWIGNNPGLYHSVSRNLEAPVYQKVEQFANVQYQWAVKDVPGQLWLGTLMGGLYRYDGKHFQMLTVADGLPSNSITGLAPQLDGSMIIGTYRGIVHYRPTATIPPQIQIREVVADEVYRQPREIEIPATGLNGCVSHLTISYHGLSFATHKIRYSYLLEPHDSEWQGTWENQVRYENLVPGEYTFKVMAISRDFVASEAPATLKLTVVPSLWDQLEADYKAEINRMQKLLELNRRAHSQKTLSDTARVIVEGLKDFGFDRAAVWIQDADTEKIRGLWGTDLNGSICEIRDEFLPKESLPPDNGYYLVMEQPILKATLGIDGSAVLLSPQDQAVFESIWGYPPPCPGYYRRDAQGENICLCIRAENERIGVIAVDNYVTKRPIDETAASLFSLVGSEMARMLASVALRESLAKREEAERHYQKQLTNLVEASNELSKADSFEELCRRAVELGRSRLGFDRMSIWLLSEDADAVIGSFGTDENGRIRNEADQRAPLDKETRDILEGGQLALLRNDIPLYDNQKRIVGHGTVGSAAMWDGEQIIGFIYTDNLLLRQPITDRDCELLALYASVLGHLCARKWAEKALIKREGRYRQVIALANAVVYEHDWVNDTFNFIGKEIEHLTGYRPDEMTPKIFEGLIREQIKYSPTLEVRENQIVYLADYRIQGRDGKIRWLADFALQFRNASGQLVNSLGILQDITERKQAEENLRESNQRLQEALAELRETQQQIVQQERLRALGQMASGIAHDFNNSLSPILGFSELLLRRPENLDNHEKVTRYLQMINTTAKDAANIVSRLREFYRYREASEIFHPVDLNRLIRSVVSLTQPMWKDQAQGEGITIEIDTNLGDIPPVAGSESELREMLTNLIFNAVDAMPDGGTIRLRTLPRPLHVVLEVSDTGAGMTEDVQKRCLEPFFSTKGERGSGLGLSIVFGILQRHEGRIEIESEPGQGTMCRIFLPIQTQLPSQPKKVELSPSRPSRLRILLVEDEPLVRQVITTYLAHDGHTVKVATHGREGLEKFSEKSAEFDVVVTDRAMPGMNGDGLAVLIKQINPNQPVIMLTGFGEMMQASGEHPVGVDVIVSKPVTLAILRQALAKAIESSS